MNDNFRIKKLMKQSILKKGNEMSYNCEKCGTHVPCKTKMRKVVTETRTKTYLGGGKGFETVTEKALCGLCANKITEEQNE